MVHAEASNFPSNLSKRDLYARLYTGAEALFSGQRNWVCNLANTASLLYHALKSLPSPSNEVNWVGFYTLDPSSARDGRDAQLILGPFMGKVACQRIRFGKGVCGTAAAEKRIVRVDDVEEYPGHIACDADSKSEIVVPIVARDCGASGSGEIDPVRCQILSVSRVPSASSHGILFKEVDASVTSDLENLLPAEDVVAVLDIDCSAKHGFDETDEEGLEKLADLIARSCDWESNITPLSGISR